MAIGDAFRRIEDPRLLRGEGRFIADIVFPDMVEAVIVRSPYAHAKVLGIDCASALAQPGVVAVLTQGDLPKPVPCIPVRLSASPELEAALQPPLALDRVRYVGEPVAVVVARNRYEAEDAADRIKVAYHSLPVVPDITAVRNGGHLIHEAVSSNVVYQRRATKGDPETVLREAAYRLDLTFRIQRHSGVPLETRGLLARVAEDGRLEVYGPTKVMHFNRQVLAKLLKCDIETIRFVEPDVGGGFGIRGEFYPEDYLIPYLALRLGCPIRWIEDRAEHLKSANQSRQQEHCLRVGFTAEGRLLALQDDIWVDSGAYIRTHGVTVPELTQAMLPGPYAWPALDIRLHVALTNKTPTGTYRGPGRFEGTFVRERAIEAVADTLRLDPAYVRRINLIAPEQFPYSNGITALGQEVVLDSGHYGRALEQAEVFLDYPGFNARRTESRLRGKWRGFGWAFFVEKSGLGPWEEARCRLNQDGLFECYTGLAALGQGTESMIAQVVSDRLGVGPSKIRVIHGDTDQVSHGNGSFASRGTVMGGSAAYMAGTALRARIAAVAAAILEASAEDIRLSDHGVMVHGVPESTISYTAIARRAAQGGIALDVRERFSADHMTYPYGVHGAEVEVDPELGSFRIVRYGVVYDIGRAINPATVKGQIVGGVAQGLGGALLEEMAYDEDGQLLSATFMDYLLPGACEVPDVDVLITEQSPSLTNPMGVKGSGEGGAVGVAPAIANALASALAAPPEAFTELPLTPQRVREWIKRQEGLHVWK